MGKNLDQEVEQADTNADADAFAHMQEIGAGFLHDERDDQHDAGDERQADRRFTQSQFRPHCPGGADQGE